jgi:TRAP-type C4-dicarboxylate transport system permease small subunit
MHRGNKLSTWVAKIEDSLLALLLGLMILLASGQILLRNLFDMGFDWSDPLLRVLVLWLGLIGAMVATREKNHITIDVLTHTLPPIGQKLAYYVINIFSSIVCATISYHATRFVLMEYEDSMIAFSNVPAWLCEIIIPVGFGLMALRFFLALFCAPTKPTPTSDTA